MIGASNSYDLHLCLVNNSGVEEEEEEVSRATYSICILEGYIFNLVQFVCRNFRQACAVALAKQAWHDLCQRVHEGPWSMKAEIYGFFSGWLLLDIDLLRIY